MSGTKVRRSGRRTRKNATKRLWRWRNNPLRRRDDIIEAWILLVMWIVILVGGAVAGTMTARAADQGFAQQRANRHPVQAGLLASVPQSASAGNGSYQGMGKVRWTAPDGTVRTGDTLLSTGLPSGTTVTVWENGRGALTTEPPNTAEARITAAVFGATAALALAGLVYGTTALARWRLDQRRYDQWGKEWDLVGPRWDQKTG